MTTTHIRNTIAGAAIAALSATSLLFLGAGTAQAIQDVSDGAMRIIIATSIPQPGPGIVDPGSRMAPGVGDKHPQAHR